jgi:hypothetical protein
MRHLIADFDAGLKSAWGKRSASECRPSREFLEARFWITSELLTMRELSQFRTIGKVGGRILTESSCPSRSAET